MPHAPTTLILTACAVAGSLAAQTACLDQSYVPAALSNGLEVTQNQPVTQTFTVGRSGLLAQVEIARINHHNGMSTNPLQVAIVTTVAGVPTTTTLASVSLPPSAVSTSIAPLLVDVSAFQVQVQAGQVLGIALTSPNAPGTPSYGWWGEAPGGSYTNGMVFIQQTIALSVWDLAFETFVVDPASWSNYGAGHPGTNGVPSLTSSANPVLGTTPAVLIGNSAGSTTLAALFLGLTATSVPTPLGGTALVVPLTSVGAFVPAAGAQVPFPLPNDPTLCGFVIDMQAVVVDGGASQGLAFTPGLEYVLGS